MNRKRVRLTAADWRRIYDALGWLIEWSGEDDIERTPPSLRECQLVLRKIGANGMAAANRGVAPVIKFVREDPREGT